MAVSLNNNITTDWGGENPKTGSEVQSAIREQFRDIVNELNDVVKDVDITSEEGKTDQINYKITYTSGETKQDSVRLIPVSSYQMKIGLFNCPQFVPQGNDLTVNYSWALFKETGEQVSGQRVQYTLTITNGGSTQKITGTTQYTSYQNAYRREVLSVNSSYIKEGVNNITLTLKYTSSEGVSEDTIYDDDVAAQISCISCKLVQNVSFDDSENYKPYNHLFEASDKFKLICSFKDSQGRPLTSNTYNQTDILSHITTTLYVGQSDNIGTPISREQEFTFSNLFGSELSSAQSIYIRSTISYGSTSTYSNVAKFVLIPSSASGSEYYAAYEIQDYNDFSNRPTNKLYLTQYDSVSLPVYFYNPSDQVINIECVKQSGSTANTFALEPKKWTKIEQSYIYSDVGTITTIIGNVSYTVEVSSISGDMSMPSNPIMSFSAYGQNTHNDIILGQYTMSFNGFDWHSNGWVTDSNDVTDTQIRALLFNNQSTATINCAFCNNTNERVISFRFKTINEDTDEEIASCYKPGCDGFRLYTQKAIIYKGGTESDVVRFSSEDSIKEVTFAWYGQSYGNLAIIYINGTSQCILRSSQSIANDSNITLTSNKTSFYLYNIEAYQKALSFYDIEAMYIMHTNVDIPKNIINNNIFDEAVTIGNNGSKVTIDNLPVGSTYMLICAHPQGPSKPWEYINSLAASYTSGNKEVATKSWRLLAGQTYLITKTADGSGIDTNFYADKIAMSAQGTSSMNYPIKNYRIYFKKDITSDAKTSISGISDFSKGYELADDGKFSYTQFYKQGSDVNSINYSTEDSSTKKVYHFEDGDIGVNRFCLKADYAESSGVHNTGFARLVNQALENSSNLNGNNDNSESYHLPQNQFDGGTRYRSCIDGRPVYLFFADSNKNDIIYSGKFNLNIDKSSEEIFGFEGDSDYFVSSGIQNEAENLKSLFNDVSSFDSVHNKIQIDDIEYTNPTECWEFSTNDAHGMTTDSLLNNVTRQIAAFTYPYTIGVAKDNANYPFGTNSQYRDFDPFSVTIAGTGELAWYKSEQAWEPRYPDVDEFDNVYQGGARPLLLESLYRWIHKHNVYLWSTEQQKIQNVNIFARDLHLYFNVNYLLKYYMLTKWFINSDQRIKNSMLSFYYDPLVENNEDIESPMGHMRAFYIFYDNDTILGVANDGSLQFPWNAKESTLVYRGIDENNIPFHGVWANLEYCYNAYINNTAGEYEAIRELGKKLSESYASLRSQISDTNLKSYLQYGDNGIYTSSQTPSNPLSINNVDAEVKYFYPSQLWPSDAVSEKINNFNADNLAKYQGSRQYHRDWILSKRTKWYDSMYQGTSIGDYKYTFKPAVQSYFVPGTIKVYSALDDWRFYFQPNEGAYTKYDFINKGEYNQITLDQASNSFDISIAGLYGCSKLDLSGLGMREFEGESIDGGTAKSSIGAFTTTKLMPYLKEYRLGDAESEYKTYIKNTEVTNTIVSAQMMPSLENVYINNVSLPNSSYIGVLDLSRFRHLQIVDLTKTDCNVNLSSSPSLTTLKLYKPTSLSLNNKPSLNTFVIEDSSNIESITASMCNSDIYNQLLTIFLANRATNNVSLNLVFGTDTQPEVISDDVVYKLAQIAKNVTEAGWTGITISGNCINSNIDSLMLGQDKCVSLITEAFEVTIQSKSDVAFELTSSDGNYTLTEGSTLTIFSSRAVDPTKWCFTVNDGVDVSDTYNIDLNGAAITISNKTKWQCKITLQQSNANNNGVYTIKVKAETEDGEQAQTNNIVAEYRAITSLTLSVNDSNNIIQGATSIYLSTNSPSKQYLLTADNLTISTTNGSVSGQYDQDILSHINYTVSQDGSDAVVTVVFKVAGSSDVVISGNISLYTNRTIVTKTVIESDTSLNWLYMALFKAGGYTALNGNISRLDLSKYDISNVANLQLSDLAETSQNVAQNLTNLQYFGVSSASQTFTLPSSFIISNVTLPEGIQAFVWNSVYESSPQSYGIMKFPSTLQKAYINLSSNVTMTNLYFNLSNCSQITSIENSGALNIQGVASGVFNLYIDTLSISGLATRHNNPLFGDGQNTIYPPNLQKIGYYTESHTNDSNNVGNAMFACSEITTSAAYNANYNLGVINKSGIKVGYLYNYTFDNMPFDLESSAGYIAGIYQTFYNCKEPIIAEFSSLTVIGDRAFYGNANAESNIKITSNVTSIGYGAFYMYEGVLQTDNNQCNLPNVTYIGDFGLSQMGIANVIRLRSIVTIGSYALQNKANGVIYTIYIDGDTLRNYESTSFGNQTSASYRNVVYITNESLATEISNSDCIQYITLNPA